LIAGEVWLLWRRLSRVKLTAVVSPFYLGLKLVCVLEFWFLILSARIQLLHSAFHDFLIDFLEALLLSDKIVLRLVPLQVLHFQLSQQTALPFHIYTTLRCLEIFVQRVVIVVRLVVNVNFLALLKNR